MLSVISMCMTAKVMKMFRKYFQLSHICYGEYRLNDLIDDLIETHYIMCTLIL